MHRAAGEYSSVHRSVLSTLTQGRPGFVPSRFDLLGADNG